MLLDFFCREGVNYPELCYLTSIAVGFPVTIAILVVGPGPGGKRYQVMRWDEREGPGLAFWNWYLCNRRQFFRRPARAAAVFVREWQKWHAQTC